MKKELISVGRRAFSTANRLQGLDNPSVWGVFTPLAAETDSINLGQGFYDYPAPSFVKEALSRAVHNDDNQYCRSQGHPKLTGRLAHRYSGILKRNVNAETEILTTVGATEAINAAIQALVNPGDEVVMFDPSYDSYIPCVKMAGGTPIGVPLKAPASYKNKVKHRYHFDLERDDWQVDFEALEAAFSNKTKVFMMNTPHNPTGKIFNKDEVAEIVKILKKYPDVIVISDDCYEAQAFTETGYFPRMAYLPEMWDRSLTIGSGGKIFGVTGWKVGWLVGAEPLIKAVQGFHQWNTFCVHTPSQIAIANCFDQAWSPYEGYDNFFDYVRQETIVKRDQLTEGLISSSLNLRLWTPAGGFFVIADISRVTTQFDDVVDPVTGKNYSKDYAFLIWLAKNRGVVGIPASAFYSEENKHLGENFVRFAFCKSAQTIEAGIKRLA